MEMEQRRYNLPYSPKSESKSYQGQSILFTWVANTFSINHIPGCLFLAFNQKVRKSTWPLELKAIKPKEKLPLLSSTGRHHLSKLWDENLLLAPKATIPLSTKTSQKTSKAKRIFL